MSCILYYRADRIHISSSAACITSSCGSPCGAFGALHGAETSYLQIDRDLMCCGDVTKKIYGRWLVGKGVLLPDGGRSWLGGLLGVGPAVESKTSP